ncbi:YggT family protein [Sulfuricystis thermophila]|uniref:YggT family protein n=1 Tax=Sulfuricystis thermophila TaxID=2496847 RepID=UPI001035F6D4|nr:YggT family protein [Sulfuricystis thermophila]
MLTQILSLLLGTAASLFSLACLARLWMQWVRAPFRNPVGQAVVVLTNWAVLPLRRLVPGLFGLDLASVLAAWLTQCVYFFVMASLTGVDILALGGFFTLVWVATLALLKLFVYLLMGIVIIAALLSWIAPYAPAAPLFHGLAAPLLMPVRRLVPVIGGLDFAPLIVVLLLQVVLIVLENLR